MVVKQLPGAEKVCMVYDARDRLVLVQDGKTRAENANKWLYTKYENNMNRPVETGWLVTTNPLTTITSDFWTAVDFPAGYTSSDILTQSGYDSYPNSGLCGLSNKNTAVKGMLTYHKSKILDGSGYTETFTFYDDKYRVVQTNVQGGPVGQVTTNTYDFVGKLTTSTETYSGQVAQTITKTFTYDHAGRLEKVEQQISGDTANGNVVLAQNDYNELGQLMLKKLHSAGETSFVQDIDYLYDVRGWLSSINDPASPSASKLYSQLNYFGNGNIQDMSWKNTMLDAQNAVVATNKQRYGFTYDGLNRITAAAYSELNASNVTVNSGNFNESYGYDSNGNIATLSRQGNRVLSRTSPVYGLIDNLTYNYLNNSNSNQLSSVSDAIASGVVSHDLEYKPATGTYTYDNNGNATYVPQRSVSATYNYLNLPSAVTVGSQGTISYLYDASGAKLKKTVGSAISYYQGSVLKINGTDIVMTGEGRAVKNGTWGYEYDLKDHLGDTRVSFSAGNGTALPQQYKDYYPYGLEMAQAYTTVGTPTKYLYNGKELQDEYGLGWYDYGARFYDPAIGRWSVIDNKAEKYYSWSPYVYAINNSIKFIDPDGNDIYIYSPGQVKPFIFNGKNASSAPDIPFVQSVLKAYAYNTRNGGGDNIKEAASNPDLKISLTLADDELGSQGGGTNSIYFNGEVTWRPDQGVLSEDGSLIASPATVMEEEFDHAVDAAKHPTDHATRESTQDDRYGNREEKRAAEGSNAKTGQANKEYPNGKKMENHRGTVVVVDGGPTSTKINKEKSQALTHLRFRFSEKKDMEKDINNINRATK